eukprot:29353_5
MYVCMYVCVYVSYVYILASAAAPVYRPTSSVYGHKNRVFHCPHSQRTTQARSRPADCQVARLCHDRAS